MMAEHYPLFVHEIQQDVNNVLYYLDNHLLKIDIENIIIDTMQEGCHVVTAEILQDMIDNDDSDDDAPNDEPEHQSTDEDGAIGTQNEYDNNHWTFDTNFFSTGGRTQQPIEEKSDDKSTDGKSKSNNHNTSTNFRIDITDEFGNPVKHDYIDKMIEDNNKKYVHDTDNVISFPSSQSKDKTNSIDIKNGNKLNDINNNKSSNDGRNMKPP